MAFTDGRRSRFRIADTDGVMRDLSAYITEVSGLPGGRTLNEVTALGDTGARFKPGAEAVQFTLRGLFDDTPYAGADAVLGALRCHTAATAFEYAPAGFMVRRQRALHRRLLGEVLRTAQSQWGDRVLAGDASS